MGGVEPAFTFVKAMLEAGKQVATSNKNLVAAKGAELIKVARDHGVNFQFEAVSVAESLLSDHSTSVSQQTRLRKSQVS